MNQHLEGMDHAIECVRVVERIANKNYRLMDIDDNGDGTCEVILKWQDDANCGYLAFEFDKALLLAEVKKLS